MAGLLLWGILPRSGAAATGRLAAAAAALQCRRGRTHEGNKCGYMLAAMEICNAIAGWAGAGGSLLGVELTGLPGIL